MHYLQPDDPLYAEIGERYIRKQTELLSDIDGGTWHIYQGDQFNEMVRLAASSPAPQRCRRAFHRA